MTDSKLNERIREIRKKYGYTQESLAEALNINPAAVKAWESPTKGSQPKISNLLAMCDLFGCDLDYLVGRLEESTHDIHFVHKYTGLSEKAIKWISSQKMRINDGPWEPGPEVTCLNHLIESDGFRDFIDAYMVFIAATYRLEDSVISEESSSKIGRDKVILRIDEATRYYMDQVAEAMKRLCEPDYRESYQVCMKNSQQKKATKSNEDRRRD